MIRSDVVVVGSISADVTAFAQRLPAPGETVLGTDFSLVLGGKGANQAVAAARFGPATHLIGCVGDDPFADLTLGSLERYGVDTTWVRRVPGPTGVAHIRVDASGQNDIVVAPLANGKLTTAMVDEALAALAPSSAIMLIQLEIPLEIVGHAARAGKAAGLTVILDPAPAAELPEELWPFVDIVTPNEGEAGALTGVEVSDFDSADRAARWFTDRGVGRAIITLGARGALSAGAGSRTDLGPYPVDAVDTTAAGDAFTGTLGAALAAGLSGHHATLFAMAASAVAVTKPGASPSLPSRAETDAMIGPDWESTVGPDWEK